MQALQLQVFDSREDLTRHTVMLDWFQTIEIDLHFLLIPLNCRSILADVMQLSKVVRC